MLRVPPDVHGVIDGNTDERLQESAAACHLASEPMHGQKIFPGVVMAAFAQVEHRANLEEIRQLPMLLQRGQEQVHAVRIIRHQPCRLTVYYSRDQG